jgi:hypothetical protein
MSKGATDTQPAATDQTALENESLGTAQNAVPVPLFAGTVKIAARFWSPLYGQRAQQAPSTATGKKG